MIFNVTIKVKKETENNPPTAPSIFSDLISLDESSAFNRVAPSIVFLST